MRKIKVIISIFIFSILLSVTSVIKNQTRIIEKEIYKIDKKIIVKKKDLQETELDFFYLSSPRNISSKINDLALTQYTPMDLSRIYFNYKDFINSEKKITNLKVNNEKKTKKK